MKPKSENEGENDKEEAMQTWTARERRTLKTQFLMVESQWCRHDSEDNYEISVGELIILRVQRTNFTGILSAIGQLLVRHGSGPAW